MVPCKHTRHGVLHHKLEGPSAVVRLLVAPFTALLLGGACYSSRVLQRRKDPEVLSQVCIMTLPDAYLAVWAAVLVQRPLPCLQGQQGRVGKGRQAGTTMQVVD
jgi:hypothetical protein